MMAMTTSSSMSVKPRRWVVLKNLSMAASAFSGRDLLAERRQPTRHDAGSLTSHWSSGCSSNCVTSQTLTVDRGFPRPGAGRRG